MNIAIQSMACRFLSKTWSTQAIDRVELMALSVSSLNQGRIGRGNLHWDRKRVSMGPDIERWQNLQLRDFRDIIIVASNFKVHKNKVPAFQDIEMRGQSR